MAPFLFSPSLLLGGTSPGSREELGRVLLVVNLHVVQLALGLRVLEVDVRHRACLRRSNEGARAHLALVEGVAQHAADVLVEGTEPLQPLERVLPEHLAHHNRRGVALQRRRHQAPHRALVRDALEHVRRGGVRPPEAEAERVARGDGDGHLALRARGVAPAPVAAVEAVAAAGAGERERVLVRAPGSVGGLARVGAHAALARLVPNGEDQLALRGAARDLAAEVAAGSVGGADGLRGKDAVLAPPADVGGGVPVDFDGDVGGRHVLQRRLKVVLQVQRLLLVLVVALRCCHSRHSQAHQACLHEHCTLL
eukprot:Rhum_TRINITY_DN678_c0_g1::Rhum_TRINITY_DN678_c0_g1_i1::g.2105::m.2105